MWGPSITPHFVHMHKVRKKELPVWAKLAIIWICHDIHYIVVVGKDRFPHHVVEVKV